MISLSSPWLFITISQMNITTQCFLLRSRPTAWIPVTLMHFTFALKINRWRLDHSTEFSAINKIKKNISIQENLLKGSLFSVTSECARLFISATDVSQSSQYQSVNSLTYIQLLFWIFIHIQIDVKPKVVYRNLSPTIWDDSKGKCNAISRCLKQRKENRSFIVQSEGMS